MFLQQEEAKINPCYALACSTDRGQREAKPSARLVRSTVHPIRSGARSNRILGDSGWNPRGVPTMEEKERDNDEMITEKLEIYKTLYSTRVLALRDITKNPEFNPDSYKDRKSLMFDGAPLCRRPSHLLSTGNPATSYKEVCHQFQITGCNALALLKEAMEIAADIRRLKRHESPKFWYKSSLL